MNELYEYQEYRFDDRFEKVYRWNSDHETYVFCCTYHGAGIHKRMSEKQKLEQMKRVHPDVTYFGI